MNTNNNFLLLSCVDGLRHTNSNNNFLLSFCVFFCVNGLRGKGRDLSNRNRCWGWRFTHLKQIASQTGDSLLLCALQLLSLHPPSKTTSASCTPRPAISETPQSELRFQQQWRSRQCKWRDALPREVASTTGGLAFHVSHGSEIAIANGDLHEKCMQFT